MVPDPRDRCVQSFWMRVPLVPVLLEVLCLSVLVPCLTTLVEDLYSLLVSISPQSMRLRRV